MASTGAPTLAMDGTYTRAYWLVAVPRSPMLQERRAACVSCHCYGTELEVASRHSKNVARVIPALLVWGRPMLSDAPSQTLLNPTPHHTRMLLHWDAAGHDASGADVPARTPQTRTSGTSRRCSTWRRPCGSRATWCPRWRGPGPWFSTADLTLSKCMDADVRERSPLRSAR